MTQNEMTQKQAVYRLGRFLGCDDCEAAKEYWAALRQNVAALLGDWEQPVQDRKELASMAVLVTHTTIAALPVGEVPDE